MGLIRQKNLSQILFSSFCLCPVELGLLPQNAHTKNKIGKNGTFLNIILTKCNYKSHWIWRPACCHATHTGREGINTCMITWYKFLQNGHFWLSAYVVYFDQLSGAACYKHSSLVADLLSVPGNCGSNPSDGEKISAFILSHDFMIAVYLWIQVSSIVVCSQMIK